MADPDDVPVAADAEAPRRMHPAFRLAAFVGLLITTTTLARFTPAAGGRIALWGATGVCGVLAALYARLFFGSLRGGTS